MTNKTEMLTEYTFEGVTLTAGDFVKAYEKGYHVVTGIQPRFYGSSYSPEGKNTGDETTPLVWYRRVISQKGKQVKSKNHQPICCDWSYVFQVTDTWLQEQKAKAMEEWDSVRDHREAFFSEPW